MKLLVCFIIVFASFMIGIVIYPMWVTDRVVLAIARESQVGTNLTDILRDHPTFTYFSFTRENAAEPCMTVVNVDGRLTVLVTKKSKRKPVEPLDLAREWALAGGCPNVTIVYEGLYRKGYVLAPVNEKLQLTDVVNTTALQ